MTIYLSQHGIALNKEENDKRPLSQTGVMECEAISKFLKNKGFIINKIFHSGKLRSMESAKIFSTILSNGEIYEKNCMNPNDDSEVFCKDLCEDSLYIGHLPQLEKIISHLVVENSVTDLIKFKNSGVVCLDNSGGKYSIKWYVTPDLL